MVRTPPQALLLPLKPRWLDMVLRGEKNIEFRRRPPRRKRIVAVLYYSAAGGGIVAYGHGYYKRVFAPYLEVHEGSLGEIWLMASAFGEPGMSEAEYLDYFAGMDRAAFFKLPPETVRLHEPLDLWIWDIRPPQSFCYLPWSDFETALRMWQP